jgi:hypothetical protein
MRRPADDRVNLAHGRPKLTAAQILAWADDHKARTGEWPRRHSGPVRGAPGESWVNVNQALRKGLRGLPGGDSLPRLLARTTACGTPVTCRPSAKAGSWPGPGSTARGRAPGRRPIAAPWRRAPPRCG